MIWCFWFYDFIWHQVTFWITILELTEWFRRMLPMRHYPFISILLGKMSMKEYFAGTTMTVVKVLFCSNIEQIRLSQMKSLNSLYQIHVQCVNRSYVARWTILNKKNLRQWNIYRTHSFKNTQSSLRKHIPTNIFTTFVCSVYMKTASCFGGTVLLLFVHMYLILLYTGWKCTWEFHNVTS